MTYAVVIASRGTVRSKTRLAPALSAGARTRLVKMMLETAYDAARAAAGYSEVILVSPSAGEVPCDVTLVADRDEGLSAAFVAACAYAGRRGHHGVALIPADLPLLRSADLEDLLRLAEATGAAIAGDWESIGTNALFLPLPLPIALAFEGQSFPRHLSLCHAAGLIPAIVTREGLAFDVDEAQDLKSLQNIPEFAFLSGAEAY